MDNQTKLAPFAAPASRLGIGTLRFRDTITCDDIRQLVQYGLNHGINYIDCAPTYCGGKCESLVGEAVLPFRDSLRLASKIPLDVLKQPGDLKHFLTETLRRMKTEYLDYYYLWAVKKAPFDAVALENGFLRELQEVKEAGMVRKTGFSFHDRPQYATEIIDIALREGMPFDAMLCQYNLLHPEMAESMAYAKKHGLEVLVMGAAAGGKLDAGIAYPFVLQNRDADIILTGVTCLSMLKEDLLLEQTQRDSSGNRFAAAAEKKRKLVLLQLYCTGCGYCMPCPARINIPSLMAVWQRYLLSKDSDKLKQDFEKYTAENGITAEHCIQCGRCEAHCPQRLPIRKWVAKDVRGAM